MDWRIRHSETGRSAVVRGNFDSALQIARQWWDEDRGRVTVSLQPADIQLVEVSQLGRVNLKSDLSGDEMVRLMRRHRRTIAELASGMGITQRRVREVRERGVDNPYSLRDWIEAITGEDLGPLPERERVRTTVLTCQNGTCSDRLSPGAIAYKYLGVAYCSVECCRRERGWDVEQVRPHLASN